MHARTKLVATILAFASIASAQSSKKADVLFHEARKLAVAGDYAHACPKFEESERLDPAPGTLLNLADCEERLGHVVAAAEHYRLAASGFPQRDDRRLYCAKKADALDARAGHLTLRLAADAPMNTVVRENGETVPSSALGRPAAVDPGQVAVVVSAPGHADESYPVDVGEGAIVEVVLHAGPASAPHTVVVVRAVPEATTRRASPLAPVGVAIGAVGLVTLGVGIATGLMAVDRANTVKTHCNTTSDVCDDVGLAAAHDGALLSPLSTALVVAGGVLAVSGAVLFIVGRTSQTHVRAAMVPGGFVVSGAF